MSNPDYVVCRDDRLGDCGNHDDAPFSRDFWGELFVNYTMNW